MEALRRNQRSGSSIVPERKTLKPPAKSHCPILQRRVFSHHLAALLVGNAGKMCPSQLLARILLLNSPCAHATIRAPSMVADLKCTWVTLKGTSWASLCKKYSACTAPPQLMRLFPKIRGKATRSWSGDAAIHDPSLPTVPAATLSPRSCTTCPTQSKEIASSISHCRAVCALPSRIQRSSAHRGRRNCAATSSVVPETFRAAARSIRSPMA